MFTAARSFILFVAVVHVTSAAVIAQFPAFFDTRELDGTNGYRIIGELRHSQTGISTATADLNGDGKRDLVTASNSSAIADELPGTVYVIFGGSSLGGVATINLELVNAGNGFKIIGQNPLANFGQRIVAGFDWNHDGIDDVVVAEPEALNAGRGFSGRVYIIFGHSEIGASGVFDIASLDGSNGFVVIGPDVLEGLMGRTLSVGDFNGDTWPDLAMGSPGNGLGARQGAGEIFVLFGGPGVGSTGRFDVEDIDGVNGFRIIGENAHDATYLGLGRIGDVNGDGIDDIGTGGPEVDALGRVDAGRCYVVFGSPTLGAGGLIDLRELAWPEGFVINGGVPGDEAFVIRGGGDVNGDGYGDLTVGGFEEYVIFAGPAIGSTGPIDLAALGWPNGVVLLGLADREASGIVGDFNADGYADIGVGRAGAWLFDDPNDPFNPRQGAGRVSIVYGARDLGMNGPIDTGNSIVPGELDGENGVAIWGDEMDRNLGLRLFGLGDVNQDGVDDFGAKVTYHRFSENLPGVDGLYVIHGQRKFALADFDLDGDVDMKDFLSFTKCYNGPAQPPAGSCPAGVRADFDSDGDVDLADYATFSRNYTGAR